MRSFVLILSCVFSSSFLFAGKNKPVEMEMSLLGYTRDLVEEYHIDPAEATGRKCIVDEFLRDAKDHSIKKFSFKLMEGNLMDLSSEEKTYLIEHFEELQGFYWLKSLNLSGLIKRSGASLDINILRDLQCLEKLNLDHNELSTIPKVVYELKALKWLSLAHNQIMRLHHRLKSLIYLEELFLEHNNISCFPHYLNKLPRLLHVSYQHNPGLKKGSEGLGTEGMKKLVAELKARAAFYHAAEEDEDGWFWSSL